VPKAQSAVSGGQEGLKKARTSSTGCIKNNIATFVYTSSCKLKADVFSKANYYSYCKTHRIKSFGRLRLVINHEKEDLSDTPTFFICNRNKWQAEGITRIRRHRWPVEVYHEEGKADGLSLYQVRSFEAIGKHIALVSVTYTLLRAAQHDTALVRKLHRNVHTTLEGSAGVCRRNTKAQALWALACFIQTALAQGHTLKDLMQPILATVTR
jgi:hypothetical protein